ncbi:NfeD family protein [Paenibacillus yanchengensis]|uniref:NfeD family protein n=1 Tax=Paenibacillus yanchengensis TaxID=2035833 RepID=A0ABW4YKF9_9BACL
METFFLVLLICGALYAVMSVIFGDILGDLLDSIPVFQSAVLVSGITTFGGSGWLLIRMTELDRWLIVVIAVLIAIVIGIIVFFLYVKPMRNSENSLAFSLASLEGYIGEVITPIPANGVGEVLIKVGAGFTNQIAASFDQEDIAGDTKIVVVAIQDHTLLVSPLHL